MTELSLPAPASSTGDGTRASLLSIVTDPSGGSAGQRLRQLATQPAVQRTLPAMAVLATLGAGALLWLALADPPQRILYAGLSDAERAGVVASLDTAGIAYTIDNATGSLSVAEGDVYKARMMVASDGALATPETAPDLLGSIPLGSSRMLEGERVRQARERELVLTIMEIEGVESVRVHLATPERSVFVREQAAPSASVMVRLARGRSLSPEQVSAIGNLVAASTPGMAAGAVRIADHHGRLLSREGGNGDRRLDLQRAHEEKLRAQIAQLLLPIIGDGNFSTEVQVELDQSEVTRAQEAYDKQGVLRSESQAQSQQTGAAPAFGVPGVLSNTPPPATGLDPAAPAGTPPAAGGTTSGESSAQRSFEVGREVSVSTTAPGGVRRISVAVALSADALKRSKSAGAQQLQQLVSAAVGANTERGDTVTVVASAFDPGTTEPLPFYETSWFPAAIRTGGALLAVLLALLFIVRPLIRTLRRSESVKPAVETTDEEEREVDGALAGPGPGFGPATSLPAGPMYGEHIQLVRTLAAERPEHAAETLRRMLAAPQGQGA